MAARNSQNSITAPVESNDEIFRISQLSITSVSLEAAPSILTSQLAITIVATDNIRYQQLGSPISLNCWSPCNSFGTYGRIYNV